MFNGKYTHLNEILERVHRDFGFEEVFADEAKEWIWDCLGYFGRDEILTLMTDEVVISENRGLLPSDIYKWVGCRDKLTKTPLLPTSDRFFTRDFPNLSNGLGEAIVQGTSIDITTTGLGDNLIEELDASTLFLEFVPRINIESQAEYTYQIQNGYIWCGVNDITLEIAYVGLPIWDDNTPKIPDDPKVIRMVVYHIAERIAFKLWMQDKITERKYQYIADELSWAVGSAASRIKMPDEDMMESIKRMSMRLVPKPEQWKNAYREMNRQETLKRM